MVNFRYHLVSLIAIFIALALGVVLGAGPLQSRLGNALDQGDGQKTDQQTIAGQLEDSRKTTKNLEKVVNDIAQRSLPSSAKGLKVAAIYFQGAADADIKQVEADITASGAHIVSSTRLTDNWDSRAKSEYRSSLSTALANAAPQGGSAEEIISSALITMLTNLESAGSSTSAILADEGSPLITVDKAPSEAADVVIVVGPRSSTTSSQERSVASWAGLADAIAKTRAGGVILGDASSEGSMISQLRAQSVATTTVDGVGTRLGSLSAVLSLSNPSNKDRLSYGVAEGASTTLPTIKNLSQQSE